MGGLTGAVVKILAFARATRNGARLSDVTVDPGGGRRLIVDHFSAPGDDAFPLPGTDYGYIAPEKQTGRYAVTGYVDPINPPKAGPGEKRIYGRNAATGAEVCEVWLKADGSVTVANANGSMVLGADGGSVLTSPDGSVTLGADGRIALVNTVCSLTLSAAGAILGQNAAGSFGLAASGVFTVNGVTIGASGAMAVPTSLVLAGKQMAGHSHAQAVDSRGDAQPDTGPNL